MCVGRIFSLVVAPLFQTLIACESFPPLGLVLVSLDTSNHEILLFQLLGVARNGGERKVTFVSRKTVSSVNRLQIESHA